MREKEVVLVAPDTPGSYKFGGKKRENLALGALASYLTKNGVSNEIIDARLNKLTPEQVTKELIRLHPSVVGFTFMEQEPAIWSQSVIKAIKEEMPSAHVVAGGYFSTLDPNKCLDILPEIDSIAQGEGEETLLELTMQVSGKQDWRTMNGVAFKNKQSLRINPRRKLIKDINTLPDPTRYADESQISRLSVEGSRGCFAHCTFCSINPNLIPNRSSWRGKDPQTIVGELVNLRKIYPNINEYKFVDSDFVGLGTNYDRLSELADGLIRSGFSSSSSKLFIETQSRNVLSIPPQVLERLRQAGLYQVFLGVETGSEKIKNRIAKPSSVDDDIKAIDYLKKIGFHVTYGFIMLTPWSDMTDILKNVEMLKSLGNAGLDKYFSELILTPGTRAFETVSKENSIYVEKVEGVDTYSYPLPRSIESIRRVGRYMLESPLYKPFLEKIASIYSQLDQLLLSRGEKVSGELRKNLDQINLDIFLKIMDRTQNHDPLDNRTIQELLSEVVLSFDPKISMLENQLRQ